MVVTVKRTWLWALSRGEARLAPNHFSNNLKKPQTSPYFNFTLQCSIKSFTYIVFSTSTVKEMCYF